MIPTGTIQVRAASAHGTPVTLAHAIQIVASGGNVVVVDRYATTLDGSMFRDGKTRQKGSPIWGMETTVYGRRRTNYMDPAAAFGLSEVNASSISGPPEEAVTRAQLLLIAAGIAEAANDTADPMLDPPAEIFPQLTGTSHDDLGKLQDVARNAFQHGDHRVTGAWECALEWLAKQHAKDTSS